MREMTYRDAIREALAEEMQRQSGMVIIGEDLLPGGGTFGIHQGLGERFRDRIFEAPISEAAASPRPAPAPLRPNVGAPPFQTVAIK